MGDMPWEPEIEELKRRLELAKAAYRRELDAAPDREQLLTRLGPKLRGMRP